MIIKPGAAQLFIAQVKTKGFDQVQLKTVVGAEADDITGVGWNLRLKQYNVKHGGYTFFG